MKLKPRPNDRNIVERNMLHAMCGDMLGVVGSSSKMVKLSFVPEIPITDLMP